MSKQTLLWIGDAVAHTGFATVTHGVLKHLHALWNVHVLGINYRGDPHSYPYTIWPASRGADEDLYGIRRLPELLRKLRPHVVCILNDPWVVSYYLPVLQEYKKQHDIRLYAYVPVDGYNVDSRFSVPLNEFDAVITYTDFGYQQLRQGGYTKPKHVIPHGVELSVFHPVPQKEARSVLQLNEQWFIVGLVNRNQPRKRLDLAFDYFSQWAADKPDTVRLYYHGAVQDVGWDIVGMAEYYGIQDRLILTSLELTASTGLVVDKLRYVYSSFDIQISTTMGEGWGLTTMEGMACGVPQIVPEWSALAEWPRGAVRLVPCTMRLMHTGGINTVGGIVDRDMFLRALDELYYQEHIRRQLREAGLALVQQPVFRWKNIAQRFHSLFLTQKA